MRYMIVVVAGMVLVGVIALLFKTKRNRGSGGQGSPTGFSESDIDDWVDDGYNDYLRSQHDDRADKENS